MSKQLDILAFEPFFGGVRRSMLETLIRCSRHRWTLLKLPPRRMERRLTIAARWFAEKVTREEVVAANVVFTSEAMNLADLLRLVPALANKPSVVYFHENRLPGHAPLEHDPLELVNLNTASAASEVWFNSEYHRGQFLQRCEAMVRRHRELASRNPMEQITAKCFYVPPPVDLSQVHTPAGDPNHQRDSGALVADLRGADVRLLAVALRQLQDRGMPFNLYTIGPQHELGDAIPTTSLNERDDAGILHALTRAGIYLSVRPDATSDPLLVQALASGCWPVVPDGGCYPELLPPAMHLLCLHDGSPDGVAARLLEARSVERPEACDLTVWEKLAPFDAIPACRTIDERLERI